MSRKTLHPIALASFVFFANPAQAVFVGDENGNLYDLDALANTSTLIGNMGVAMFDIALNPLTSSLYGVSGSGNFYQINTTDASKTSLGNIGSSNFINGLTFDSAGTLYGSGGTSLYTVNLLNGAASVVGSTGFSSSGDLAFDSSGNLFLSATDGVGGDQLVSVDKTTGAGTKVGDIGYDGVFGLNYVDTVLYGFTVDKETLTIDLVTGAGTKIFDNGIKAYGADGAGGVVPIPAAAWLFASALGVFGYLGKRRAVIFRSSPTPQSA